MGQALPFLVPAYGVYQALNQKEAKTYGVGDDVEKDRPSTLALRGSVVPYLVGHKRVGAVICWVGDRSTQQEVVGVTSSGGGKGSSKKRSRSQTQTVYVESGWHAIVVGPATRLHRIWANGKEVFGPTSGGPIDSTSDPSGSSFQDTEGNTFTIFWGERNQAVNTFLSDSARVGIASRWPNLCYVIWEERNLGPRPTWPLIEYEIEVAVEVTARADPLIECTYPDFSNGSGGYNQVLADPANNGGYGEYNAAHIIDRILFEQWPQGLGLDTTHAYPSSWEELAELVEAEGVFSSVLSQSGESAAEVIEGLLADLSVYMTWQVRHSTAFVSSGLCFKPLRDPSTGPTPPSIPDSALAQNEAPEIEVPLWEKIVSHVVWQFGDREMTYQDQTITVHEDGQSEYLDHAKAQKIGLPSVTSFAVAAIVAERRAQEVLAQVVSFRFTATKAARYLVPGDVVFLEGILDALRVTEVKVRQFSAAVDVEAIVDVYGVTESTFAPATSGGGPTGGSAPLEDLVKVLKELPAELAASNSNGTGKVYVIVPRIRADDQQGSAAHWISRDNTSYAPNSNVAGAQTGGELTEALAATDPWEIAQGPQFTVEGPDIAQVEDLSAAALEPTWRAGRQLCLIGGELFFLRKVTAISATVYRLDGLIRARYNTAREAHAIGAKVLIFTDDIPLIEDPLLQPEEDVYVKPRPFATTLLSLASITPVSKTPLYGLGVRPEPPVNLHVEAPVANVSTYSTGEDVTLAWDYFSWVNPGTGAGSLPAGLAVPGSPLRSGETFKLVVKDSGGTVVRTVTGLTDPEYTYTNANIQSDLGSEDDFTIEVFQVFGLESDPAATLDVVFV